jgi:hypothetical protein
MPYTITSRFHSMESIRKVPHNGVDFKMQIGEPIRSIKDGIVQTADYGNRLSGKTVYIKWEDGRTSVYGHLNDFTVQNGQHIHSGDLVGHAGNTGFSTGSHLHFALKENGHFVDPSSYISDIQNMNTHVVNHMPDVIATKVNFFDYMQQHMNVLSDLKIHLIHLPYDTLLIQIGKQLLQFISVHASLINNIIACIF